MYVLLSHAGRDWHCLGNPGFFPQAGLREDFFEAYAQHKMQMLAQAGTEKTVEEKKKNEEML